MGQCRIAIWWSVGKWIVTYEPSLLILLICLRMATCGFSSGAVGVSNWRRCWGTARVDWASARSATIATCRVRYRNQHIRSKPIWLETSTILFVTGWEWSINYLNQSKYSRQIACCFFLLVWKNKLEIFIWPMSSDKRRLDDAEWIDVQKRLPRLRHHPLSFIHSHRCVVKIETHTQR